MGLPGHIIIIIRSCICFSTLLSCSLFVHLQSSISSFNGQGTAQESGGVSAADSSQAHTERLEGSSKSGGGRRGERECSVLQSVNLFFRLLHLSAPVYTNILCVDPFLAFSFDVEYCCFVPIYFYVQIVGILYSLCGLSW